MLRITSYIVVFIVAVLVAVYATDTVVSGISTSLAAGVLFALLENIINNWKYMKYLWWSIRHYRNNVRLSISYLLRMKDNGEYFLIKGHKIQNQYQPVGGVYKRLPSSKVFFDSIKAMDDDLFSIDESTRDDLRINIQGKYLLKFMKWFDSEHGREICPWREFQEELLASDILSAEQFPIVLFEKVRRHENGVKWSKYSKSFELLVADVFEPVFQEKQKQVIHDLRESGSDQYIFACTDQIERNGVTPQQQANANISETSAWVI